MMDISIMVRCTVAITDRGLHLSGLGKDELHYDLTMIRQVTQDQPESNLRGRDAGVNGAVEYCPGMMHCIHTTS